jgi:transcriptional regulator with XRE-family HTH domain
MNRIDPTDPSLTTGQRIKHFRTRRGLSRKVLGDLVGKSAEWVKAVENGRLLPPRLPMLVQLAELLKVADLAALTGGHSLPVHMFTNIGHPALPAVRDAINWYPFGRDEPPGNLGELRRRLSMGWIARHASPDHRTVLGGILPGLIRDATYAVHIYEGNKRREAQAILAEVLNLSQMFLAYQPGTDLLWRVSDRAMVSAHDSGDPLAITGAVWFLVQAQRDAGEWESATTINREAIRTFADQVSESTDLLAMWGALHFEMAYTASRAGHSGEAWGWWDQADRIAERLPQDYYQPWTSFSRVIMGAHAVTVDVELRHGGEAQRHAVQLEPAAIPSRPRRSRHLIEVARGHYLKRDYHTAVQTLLEAHSTAPETIRYNGYAKAMILEILDTQPTLRRQANDLAAKVGLV